MKKIIFILICISLLFLMGCDKILELQSTNCNKNQDHLKAKYEHKYANREYCFENIAKSYNDISICEEFVKEGNADDFKSSDYISYCKARVSMDFRECKKIEDEDWRNECIDRIAEEQNDRSICKHIDKLKDAGESWTYCECSDTSDTNCYSKKPTSSNTICTYMRPLGNDPNQIEFTKSTSDRGCPSGEVCTKSSTDLDGDGLLCDYITATDGVLMVCDGVCK